MSRDVVELYVDCSGMVFTSEHFVTWLFGWMYKHGFKLRCREIICGKCKMYRCGEPLDLATMKIEIENDVNIFDLAMMLGRDVLRLRDVCFVKVKIGVCKGDECVDVNMKDIKRWWYEEILSKEQGL